MTTKEYLSQITRLNRVIENKFEEIKQLRELAYGLKSTFSANERVQSSTDPDKTGTSIAKIDELERNLDAMIDEYVTLKNKIISQIDSMEDETLYTILFSRYVEKKTFEKISTETSYCYRQVTRLHGKALREFENKYGKEYSDI